MLLSVNVWLPIFVIVAVWIALLVLVASFPKARVALLPFRYTRLLAVPPPRFVTTKLCDPAVVASALAALRDSGLAMGRRALAPVGDTTVIVSRMPSST